MIYFIGGPPKCGKTTLAKHLSKKLGLPWVSSDTLEVIGRKYVQKFAKEKFTKLYPHSAVKGKNNDETYSQNTPKQIAKNYIKQSKATYDAVDMFSICEISDGNDYIVEGYHITPELVSQLMGKYDNKNFKAIFLFKSDQNKFIQNIKKSSTPNDWIISKTKNENTFPKIAEMISGYGEYFHQQSLKYKLPVLNMDDNFELQIEKATEILFRK